ncbi:hypothetical protein [Actinoplanes sp. TFC3]|uniref:hypothetical protein n=1 Tax=Actinoplanes sp. TFC3 TaxID=1710355 RepID=UPI00083049D4|nr:hypothetical protein [Actinoplanes sp. TFC3]
MTVRRRLFDSIVLSSAFLLIAGAASATGPAEATRRVEATEHHHQHVHVHVHEHGPESEDEDSAEHRAQDLAGTPMRTIEQQTAANAARIQRSTGLRPGTPRTTFAAPGDPGLSGSWSAICG